MKSKIDWFLTSEIRLMKVRKRKVGIYIFRDTVSNHFPGVKVDHDTEIEKVHADFGVCNIADPYFVWRVCQKISLKLVGIVLILSVISRVQARFCTCCG